MMTTEQRQEKTRKAKERREKLMGDLKVIYDRTFTSLKKLPPQMAADRAYFSVKIHIRRLKNIGKPQDGSFYDSVFMDFKSTISNGMWKE